MMRLTEKDELGNWCLKGVRWEQLREGQVITKEVSERLYGALCKLKDYEDTGCKQYVEILFQDADYNTESWLDGAFCTCPACEKDVELDEFEYV